jgi:hypothetical protein
VASSVGKQVASRLNKVAREVNGASKPAVNKAANIVKTFTLVEVTKASGGDLRLSGVGRKGAKVGVRYKIGGASGDVEAVVSATGPLHFVEHDTKPGPRHRRKGRRGRANAFGAGPPKPAMHPGTKGKQPFKKGVAKAKPYALKALRAAQTDALKRGFR